MAAFSLLITSSGVQVMGETGTLTTLPLPTSVTMIPGRRARTAILNNRIIIAGATTAPIWLGEDLVLRLLSMPTPTSAPTLAAGVAGSYTGTRRARVSFTLRNAQGAMIAEGPLGPISLPVTATAQQIDFTALPLPPTGSPVTGRRVYLTTDGGSTYFAAFDVEDVTSTTASDASTDAQLSLVAADADLVAAPGDIDLLVTWKNRVWARSAIDTLVGTKAGYTDRWPNSFSIDPRGSDSVGITGFLPRRDELAIGRRHVIWKLIGEDEDTFALVKVAEGRGIRAADTCKVINDVGYFLGEDGVYAWDGQGLHSLTDDTVRPWFTTDTYFNRAYFANAFAEYDPIRHRYVLFLPAAGATVYNRWIELDILTGKWFGPHKSDVVTSWLSATIAPDGNDVLRMVMGGSDGYVYALTPSSSTDGPSTAIDFDVQGKFHAGTPPEPDITHVWLEPSIFTSKESAGTLSVIPTVGTLASSAGTTLSHALTSERGRLPRLGVGRLAQFRFRENTAGQGLSLYGYELPYIDLGRR